MPTFITAKILAEATTVTGNSNEFAAATLPLVVVLGFLAAVTLGSIAWYNSKRPMGWENKKRPDIVPNIPESENPGIGNPPS